MGRRGLVLAILFVLIPATTLAFWPGTPGANGVEDYCLGDTDCTILYPGNCDLACEDFNGKSLCDSDDSPAVGSKCWNIGAAVEASGDDVSLQPVPGTFPCKDAGGFALLIDITAINHQTLWKLPTLSDVYTTNTQFWFYLDSITLPTNDIQSFYTILNNAASSMAVRLSFINVSGNIKLYIQGSSPMSPITGDTVISEDTWYRVQLEANETSDEVNLYLNGSETPEFAATDFTGSIGMGRYYWGALTSGYTEATAIRMYFKHIAVDSADMPGDCN